MADLGRNTYQLFAKGFVTGWTGQRTGKISRTASSLKEWRGKCCRLGALDDAMSFSGGQRCF